MHSKSGGLIPSKSPQIGFSKELSGIGIGQRIAFARYKNNKTFAIVGVELEVNDSPE